MHDEKIAPTILKQFYAINKRHAIYTYFILGLLILETLAFLITFPFFFKTGFFSVILALWIATFFGYFIFKNYLVSEREVAYDALGQKFIRGILTLHPEKTPIDQRKRAAQELIHFAEKEPIKYQPPEGWRQKIKAFFSRLVHGDPLGLFSLTLYRLAKEELAGVIRLDPCSLNAHLSLAKLAESLSTLYRERGDKKSSEKLLKQAIEEYKVLLELQPHTISFYLDLAHVYHLLGMTPDEKATLERGRHIAPNDSEILLRLGKLYFISDEAAKGFKVYEALKAFDPSKSDQLIAFYR